MLTDVLTSERARADILESDMARDISLAAATLLRYNPGQVLQSQDFTDLDGHSYCRLEALLVGLKSPAVNIGIRVNLSGLELVLRCHPASRDDDGVARFEFREDPSFGLCVRCLPRAERLAQWLDPVDSPADSAAAADIEAGLVAESSTDSGDGPPPLVDSEEDID